MPDTSKLNLRIYDGTRQLFAAPADFLVTIVDGNQTTQVRDTFSNRNTLSFDLPFFNNFGDSYRVLVYADGYRQAGYSPVILSNAYTRTLDIMLVSKDSGFSFVNARFPACCSKYSFLGAGADNATGEARFDDLTEKEKPLASLLNLCEAMSQINLSHGTPLDYIRQLRWDVPFAPAQDRFFAWCDPELIQQILSAPRGQFAPEFDPGLFHPTATRSWKQTQFGEANVQLTFHENEPSPAGTNWVLVEPDMDYYQDLGAHAIFEVVPNAIDHTLTNPTEVYILRWIAGQTAGIPQFEPLYTIT